MSVYISFPISLYLSTIELTDSIVCIQTFTCIIYIYIGHNIAIGGCVASATKELDDKLHFYMNIHGNIMSPQTAFYMLQTTKTMGLRFRQQCVTAHNIACFLMTHPKVLSGKIHNYIMLYIYCLMNSQEDSISILLYRKYY